QKGNKPVVDDFERTNIDAVEPTLTVFADAHQLCLAQHLEVLRHGRLADAQLADDLRDVRAGIFLGRAAQKKLKDVAPCAVCDHVEDVGHEIRLVSPGPEYHVEGASAILVEA